MAWEFYSFAHLFIVAIWIKTIIFFLVTKPPKQTNEKIGEGILILLKAKTKKLLMPHKNIFVKE